MRINLYELDLPVSLPNAIWEKESHKKHVKHIYPHQVDIREDDDDDLDIDQLLEYLQKLKDEIYIPANEAANPLEQGKNKDDVFFKKIYKIFGLDKIHDRDISHQDIQYGFHKILFDILSFKKRLLTKKLIDHGPTPYNFEKEINRLQGLVVSYKTILINFYQVRLLVEDKDIPDIDDMSIYMPYEYNKLNDIMKAYHFVLYKLQEHGYRYYREACYRQIVHNSFKTRAWERVISVTEFVRSCVSKEENIQIFSIINAKGNLTHLTEMLSKTETDYEFPRLKPERTLFSFQNGVYDADVMEFYAFTDANFGKIVPVTRTAVKFLNCEFDLNLCHYDVTNFAEIETDILDQIFTTQELDPRVVKIIYAFMGRCLYNLAQYDEWETLMFIKGKAGSGKSTLGRIIKEFFPEEDVGILSTNVEPLFGLAPLYDKLVMFCLEVKKDFRLNQALLQSMISAEPISMPVKHKDPIFAVWKVPFMFFGNELASCWRDASGSLARRFVIVEFEKIVPNTDTKLLQKIRQNLASILVKINLAYRALVQTVQSNSLHSFLYRNVKYFNDTTRRFVNDTSPVLEFINSGEMELGDGKKMPLKEFKKFFANYRRSLLMSNYRPSRDELLHAFDMSKITVINDDSGIFQGVEHNQCDWVHGICPKISMEQLNDSM